MEYVDNMQIKVRPLYKGLVWCFFAAGVFAAIAGALLLINSYYREKIDRQNVEHLQKMQLRYESQPHSVDLATKIRALDAQVRRDALRRQGFGQAGAEYFAISLVIAFVFLLISRMMLRPEPVIPKQPVCAGDFQLWAKRSRIAAAAAAAVIAGVGLFLVFYDC